MQVMKCVCPHCATALKITQTAAGMVRCPRCNNPFTPEGIRPTPVVVVPIAPLTPAATARPIATTAPRSNRSFLLGLAFGGLFLFLGLAGLITLVAWGTMGGQRSSALQANNASSGSQPNGTASGPGPRTIDLPPAAPNELDVAANLTSEQQAQISTAIEKGVEYLKKAMNGQAPDQHSSRLGGVALGMLTLLSCGVPSDDPVVVKALERIRKEGANSIMTYDLSLCILALDRLNDPADRDLIRSMALRLIAGQNASGGWTYSVHYPVAHLSSEQRSEYEQAFLERLRTLDGSQGTLTVPVGGSRRPVVNPTDDPMPKPGFNHAAAVENLPIVKADPDKPIAGFGGDNSNTQFATLAVWAAQKHGVPVQRSMRLIDARFRQSQNQDGSWGYHSRNHERPDPMTCAGLIGLAVGKGINTRQAGDKDEVIDRAVTRLSQGIGKVPIGAKPHVRLAMNSLGDLYYLWSLERVAVIYKAKEIGGKEWYPWGAMFLVDKQSPDGAWRDYWAGLADTCFALLFLKRANVAQDLTGRIGDLNLLSRVK